MFSRRTVPVWIGILFLALFFLRGQDSWSPCLDGDGDGYGSPADQACRFPDFDCDDENPSINPGQDEVTQNGLDDDCNPLTPDEPGPLLSKALEYSRNFQEVHSPAFGCSVEVEFVSESDPTVKAYHDLGDSTIWTGNYAAAEAYRYAVTKDRQAKAFGLRAVECLLAMEEVSGKPGFIARWVGPAVPPFLNGPCEPEQDCHLVSDGAYAGNFWKGNTSSDQYLGWWYGLSHAYDLLLDKPEDEAMRRRIRQAVKRVISTLRREDYLIIDPDGTVSTAGPEIVGNEALAFHLVTAKIAGGRWAELMPRVYLEQWIPYNILTTFPISRWFQYYAFHLGHMAQHMMLRAEASPLLLDYHRQMHRDRLYAPIADTQQVMFDYIAFGEKALAADPQVLADDKAALSAFPEPPKRQLNPEQGPYELDPAVDQINEILEFLEVLTGEEMPTVGPQALEPFPVEERCVTGFRWQSRPYEFCRDDNPVLAYPGEDYLVAYWMGRHFGFLNERD